MVRDVSRHFTDTSSHEGRKVAAAWRLLRVFDRESRRIISIRNTFVHHLKKKTTSRKKTSVYFLLCVITGLGVIFIALKSDIG
jgi:hypothetical protein